MVPSLTLLLEWWLSTKLYWPQLGLFALIGVTLRTVFLSLKGLIMDFLWSSLDGTKDARVKVAWDTLILPTHRGGLNIIDPDL